MPAFRTWSESTGAKRDWKDDIVDLIRIPGASPRKCLLIN